MGSGRLFCVWALIALACSGCNQVLGLDPPVARDDTIDAMPLDDGAPDDDGAASDASPADAEMTDGTTPIDARLIDAPPASCGSRGTPCVGGGYCNGAGTCVACTTNTHCGNPTPMSCTMPVCTADSCGTGPAPRDTFCNNWADQCDGMGDCVDCTTSGGCGECCACFDQVCRPV